MINITYKIVKKAPLDDLIKLYEAEGWAKDNSESRKVLSKIVENSFCFIIALDQDKIIGTGRVISDGVSDAYIQDVVVHKDYRSSHIGYDLVHHLTQYCLQHHIQWIGLIAEPHTEKFYEKLGFTPLKNYTPMLYKKE